MPRAKMIPVRVSGAEKALIEEKAQESGFPNVSEYLRQLGMQGGKPRPAAPRRAPKPVAPDLEARVRELSLRMPRRNAEVLAKREMQRAA